MPAVNCVTRTMTCAQAELLQEHLAGAGYSVRSRAVRSVPELREIMGLATTQSAPLAFALAKETFAVWERWGDSVGAAYIVVESVVAALVVMIDGRDELAVIVMRECLRSIGFDVVVSPPVGPSQHGLIVINNPRCMSDFVSILPVALIFPAFTEHRRMPD